MPSKIRLDSAQGALAGTFILFLVANVAAVAAAYFRGFIYSDNLTDLLIQFLTIYSVPLGVIVGGVFAESGDEPREKPRGAFRLALALALVWNLLLLLRSGLFAVSSEDSIEDLSSYLLRVSAVSTFLVGAGLAYFFASGHAGVRGGSKDAAVEK